MTTNERFPFAPLEQAARGDRPRHTHPVCMHCTSQGDGSAACLDDHGLAQILGVSHRQVYRYRHNGLNDETADHLAVRIGRHPVEIWPGEWLAIEWTPEDIEEQIGVAA